MIEKILSTMLLNENNRSIQAAQTRHRIELAHFWGIKSGEKILEIGCGQGDTTAVLAELVGENGEVVALDIAQGDYGRPYTLAQSMAMIKSSAVGPRIAFHLETDFLADSVQYPDKYFDKIILSHCSWYFEEQEQLARMVEKATKVADIFCYAEWDTRVTSVPQLAHFYSVHIQNQYNLLAHHHDCNIRTLITRDDLFDLMLAQGGTLQDERLLQDAQLQDGAWEVSYVLDSLKGRIAASEQRSHKAKQFFHSQISELERYADSAIDPLNVHSSIWRLPAAS